MSDLNNLDLANPVIKKELEEQVDQENQEEKKEKTISDYLAQFPNSPDEAQLERWKQVHGDILCSGLSTTELFVFRPITRLEFVNLQAFIASQKGSVSNFEVEKKIVETCVLWASDVALQSLEKKAGTYTTLQEQVLQASNFVDPAYASQFVIRL